jgi:hypothetical protein
MHHPRGMSSNSLLLNLRHFLQSIFAVHFIASTRSGFLNLIGGIVDRVVSDPLDYLTVVRRSRCHSFGGYRSDRRTVVRASVESHVKRLFQIPS